MSTKPDFSHSTGADEILVGAPDDLPSPLTGRSARLDLSVIAREETMKLTECLFLPPDSSKAPRTVIFSSVDQGDGSSRICARVGEALAKRVPELVCLVDANLYSPSLHQQFGVENAFGLQEMILETGPARAFARRSSVKKLWLMTSGKHREEPHVVLSSSRLRERLAELRKDFAYLLIDSPAISINGTATLLGPLSDGVVLVVEANSTRREVARNAKDRLERANVRLLGAVLNNRTFPIPDLIYRSI